MDKIYTVHGAHDTTMQGQATLSDGSQANVVYHCFKVELVPDSHDSGTLTLEYHTNEDVANAKAFFTDGKKVVVSFNSLATEEGGN